MGDDSDSSECSSRPETSGSTEANVDHQDPQKQMSKFTSSAPSVAKNQDSPALAAPTNLRVGSIKRSCSTDTAQLRISDPDSRKKPLDSASKTADWTAKLKKAQSRIEAVCPFCRHVICSQRCQDRQCLRYAWDVWADVAERLNPYGALPLLPSSSLDPPRAAPLHGRGRGRGSSVCGRAETCYGLEERKGLVRSARDWRGEIGGEESGGGSGAVPAATAVPRDRDGGPVETGGQSRRGASRDGGRTGRRAAPGAAPATRAA
jgi:hypothetical protein